MFTNIYNLHNIFCHKQKLFLINHKAGMLSRSESNIDVGHAALLHLFFYSFRSFDCDNSKAVNKILWVWFVSFCLIYLFVCKSNQRASDGFITLANISLFVGNVFKANLKCFWWFSKLLSISAGFLNFFFGIYWQEKNWAEFLGRLFEAWGLRFYFYFRRFVLAVLLILIVNSRKSDNILSRYLSLNVFLQFLRI